MCVCSGHKDEFAVLKLNLFLQKLLQAAPELRVAADVWSSEQHILKLR